MRRGRQRAASKPRSTSISWPSTSIDRKSKPSGACASFSTLSSVRIGTSMTASGVAPGAIPERSSDDKGPATCSGNVRPSFSGPEQATPKTLAIRMARNSRTRSGCGSISKSGPAGLFEMPGLRAHPRFVGADFDEIAFAVAEERGNHLHLGIEGNAVQGRASSASSAAFARASARPSNWSTDRAPDRPAPPCRRAPRQCRGRQRLRVCSRCL